MLERNSFLRRNSINQYLFVFFIIKVTFLSLFNRCLCFRFLKLVKRALFENALVTYFFLIIISVGSHCFPSNSTSLPFDFYENELLIEKAICSFSKVHSFKVKLLRRCILEKCASYIHTSMRLE